MAGFAAFNAFGAWAGAVGLVTGGMDFGESINDRLPFDSVVLAGFALGAIVGIPLTVLAWLAWTGGRRTDDVALAVGLMLIVWIVVQVAVIRAFSLFQPAYLAVGAYFVAASHRVSLSPHRRGVLFVAVGSVLAAVGVGLVPHPIKNGLTTMSVVAIALLLSGIALVGSGAMSALRGRRCAGRGRHERAVDRDHLDTVAGADHTGGHDTEPDAWERRVIAFLDESLMSKKGVSHVEEMALGRRRTRCHRDARAGTRRAGWTDCCSCTPPATCP